MQYSCPVTYEVYVHLMVGQIRVGRTLACKGGGGCPGHSLATGLLERDWYLNVFSDDAW